MIDEKDRKKHAELLGNIHQQDMLTDNTAVCTIVSVDDVTECCGLEDEDISEEWVQEHLPGIAKMIHEASMNCDVYWEAIRQYVDMYHKEE